MTKAEHHQAATTDEECDTMIEGSTSRTVTEMEEKALDAVDHLSATHVIQVEYSRSGSHPRSALEPSESRYVHVYGLDDVCTLRISDHRNHGCHFYEILECDDDDVIEQQIANWAADCAKLAPESEFKRESRIRMEAETEVQKIMDDRAAAIELLREKLIYELTIGGWIFDDAAREYPSATDDQIKELVRLRESVREEWIDVFFESDEGATTHALTYAVSSYLCDHAGNHQLCNDRATYGSREAADQLMAFEAALTYAQKLREGGELFDFAKEPIAFRSSLDWPQTGILRQIEDDSKSGHYEGDIVALAALECNLRMQPAPED